MAGVEEGIAVVGDGYEVMRRYGVAEEDEDGAVGFERERELSAMVWRAAEEQ